MSRDRGATAVRDVGLRWRPRLLGTACLLALAGCASDDRFAAPSATWGDTAMADPLEVVAHVLGGGPGSRLHAALVESGLATGAGASYDGDALGVGTLTVFATPRPGATQDRIEQVVDAELAKLVQDGVSEAETRRAVRQQRNVGHHFMIDKFVALGGLHHAVQRHDATHRGIFEND